MARPRRILSDNEKKLILVLMEMGQTDEQIGKVIGLSSRSFSYVLKENGITAATKREHKGIANAKVEASLYNQAMKGNITACIFWLCNREPDRWQNLQQVKHTGSVATVAKVLLTDLKGKNAK